MGGTQSKILFQEKLDRLGENIQIDDEYWTELFSTPLTLQDAFDVISPEGVRRLKSHKRVNLTNLLKKMVITLRTKLDLVARSPPSEQPSQESSTTFLTCIYLLTRIMPFLLEDPDDEFIKNLFWRPGSYVPPVQQQFLDQATSEIKTCDMNTTESNAHHDQKMTVGVELLACLQRLLFLRGFTCPAVGVVLAQDELLPRHRLDTRFLWKGGIGANKELPHSASPQMMRNRTDVLRCLLVCLSGSLYQSIETFQSRVPPFIKICTRGELPYTANLFASLLSTILSHDPVGYGVPYGSVLSGTDEVEMVHLSLQVICVLLDYSPSMFSQMMPANINMGPSPTTVNEERSPIHEAANASRITSEGNTTDDPTTSTAPHPQPANAPEASAVPGSAGAPSASRGNSAELEPSGISASRNVYRSMLGNLKKDAELTLLVEGFARLLNSALQSQSGYFPKSRPQVPYNEVVLLLLWKCSTSNTHFLRKLTAKGGANRILLPILHLILSSAINSKSNAGGPSRIGVLHMCSFLLLVLSSERDFAVCLNEPFNQTFPLQLPPFNGCHADLLVLVVHKVIIESVSAHTQDSLIDMLLTVLCNVSAYIKSFCLESCVKILNLVQRFSRPSWLFSAPYHYHDIFYLLDTLNNVIQYQYEGNQQLVYSMLRQKDLFQQLQRLELRTTTNHSADNSVEVTINGTVATAQSTSRKHSTTNPDTASQGASSLSKTKAPSSSECERTDIAVVDNLDDRWSPTQGWFSDWKNKLPIQAIARLLQYLVPMVEKECLEKSLIDSQEVLKFLHRTTLVGLLPVPHPIVIRNYQPNVYTALWFTSYMWGVLFTASQSLPLHDWRRIKLIVINDRVLNNSLSDESSSEGTTAVQRPNTEQGHESREENTAASTSTVAHEVVPKPQTAH